MSKRFYIAHRADGKPGKGTKADPFNGSGEQLDRSITEIRRLTGVNDPVTLQFGADEFRTAGISWRPNWKGIGAGLGKTCLSLVDVGDSHFHWPNVYVIASPHYQAAGDPVWMVDAAVSHLTVNANWENQSAKHKPAVKFGGVYFAAIRARIHSVRATNCGSNGLNQPHSESFPLFIETPNREDAHGWISHCLVDHQHEFAGAQATGINITTIQDREQPSGDAVKFGERIGRGGLIEHCIATIERGHGFGCGWAENVEFKNNLAIGCKTGFNCDTGSNRGIVFRGNRFVRCHQGFSIGQEFSGEFRGFDLKDNYVGIVGPWLNAALQPARTELTYAVRLSGRTAETKIQSNLFISEAGPRSKADGSYGIGTGKGGEQIAWRDNEFVDLTDAFAANAPVYRDGL